VTPKDEIAKLRAMLGIAAGSHVYHDDKIEAHDRQIEALIRLAQEQTAELKELGARTAELIRAGEQSRKNIDALERQWQAYVNTLPRQ
jgi:hypothetical protein